MKYFLIILTICSLGSIIGGFALDTQYSQKMIGFGIAALFFIVFPLFAIHQGKNKNFKDYMLTKENLDKMREKGKEKKF